MEIELEPEEKSVDSFQAEMDLVKEEEETENRLSQKERSRPKKRRNFEYSRTLCSKL